MYSLFLQPTTEQEIVEICTSLLEGTAAGYDKMTMNVIKGIKDLIVQPLTNFLVTFSLSLSVSLFVCQL